MTTASDLRELLSVNTAYTVALEAIQHTERLEAENQRLRGGLGRIAAKDPMPEAGEVYDLRECVAIAHFTLEEVGSDDK